MISCTRSAGLILLQTAFLLCVRAFGAGNEQINSCPLPAWFSPRPGLALDVESQRPVRADVSSTGEEFILLDRQIDIASDATTVHIAYRITSQAGLSDGAQLSQSFDPSFESFAYHFIRVWRNGHAQDRLNLAEIKVLQQERDLDRQMYNGQLSTLLLLHDVRVGDIIEYACTRTGANPVFNGKFIFAEYHGWVSPMRQQRLRVIVPPGRTVNFREQGGRDLRHTERPGPDGGMEHWWEGFDLPPITADSDVPGWFVQFPYLELSEFRDWAEVADWAYPLYEHPQPLSREIKDKLATLTRAVSTPEAKVLAVLDFVQREIRYLGIEPGPNTHRPHQPDEVFAQRFGDCKDKTLLFCAMLRELGIQAYPTLVNTYRRDKMASLAPSPYAFNHVITQVLLSRPTQERDSDPAPYYLDATQSYQRGNLRARCPADTQSGLVIAPGARALTLWPGEPSAQSRTEVNETYDLTGYDQPATVKITYDYGGEMANQSRYYFANNSPEQVMRGFVDSQKRAHPNLRLQSPPKWVDDEDRNVLHLSFSYTVPDLWKAQDNKPGVYQTEFYPWLLRNYVNQPDKLTRAAPLLLPHPVNLLVRFTINFADDWALTDSRSSIQTSWYTFSSYSRYSARTLEMVYQWVSLKDHVTAADLPAHIGKLEEIRKHVGYTLTRNVHLTQALKAFSWNWFSVALTVVVVSGWLLFGRWLLLRPRPAEPPLIADPNLRGIGGWLLLPALSLVLRPFISVYYMSKSFAVHYDNRIWISYMSSESTLYQPAMNGLLLFELAGNLSLLMLNLVTALFFFKCRHYAPKLTIALLIYVPVFLSLDYGLSQFVNLANHQGAEESIRNALQGLLAAGVWVPYFLVSRRVRATFIH